MMKKIVGDHEPKIFYPFLLLLVLGVVTIIAIPDKVLSFLTFAQKGIIFNAGWFVQLLALVVIGFAFVVIIGPYGNIKLGKEEDKPEYSTFAWVSMLFCAAFGMTIWMWGAGEALFHLNGFERIADAGFAGKPQGVTQSIHYMLMDNTLHGWALFALGGAAIALPAYRKGMPLTLASGLYGLMGEKCQTSIWGRVVDIVGAIASIGGVAGALGIGIAIIASGVQWIFELSGPLSDTGKFIILVCIVIGFVGSALVGIDKGMKLLSQLNIFASIAIALFICLVGPTLYIFTTITESLGHFLDNFFTLALWGDSGNFVLDPATNKQVWKPRGHTNWWLVFYIFWWISYIPFCGGFVARISKGRTLRSFFLGAVLAPSLLTVLFFGTLSAAAAYAQMTSTVDVWNYVEKDFGSAIYAVISQYPLKLVGMILVVLSATLYGITTYDSTTQYVAIQMSGGKSNPTILLRIFIGVVLGVIGLGALLTGSLDVLKSLPIVFGVPFVFVLIAYLISTAKMLGKIQRGEM